MPADNSCINLPGPWRHRLVSASGAQFHIAMTGPELNGGPLVLLVHGFPQYWYAFRYQLEALGQAGYTVAALDVRGAGGSDRTRGTYDGPTLSRDISGVIRSLGASQALLVGQGSGGDLCWVTAITEPALIAGLVTLSAPHPLDTHRAGFHVTFKSWKHTLRNYLPSQPEKSIKRRDVLEGLLKEFSAPDATGPLEALDAYVGAMNLPHAAKSQIEQVRWSWHSINPLTGRQQRQALSVPVNIPVVTVRGGLDPLLPDRAWSRTRDHVTGPLKHIVLPRAGHFLAEEAPIEVSHIIEDAITSSLMGTDQ